MIWFKKESNLPTEPVKYFPGTVVKTEEGHWYVGEKTRKLIPTKRVLKSWCFPRVVKTSEAALANYPKMGKLGFRPGTFLFDVSSGVYYLVVKDALVLLDSPDYFEQHDLYSVDALSVSAEEIALHERGDFK